MKPTTKLLIILLFCFSGKAFSQKPFGNKLSPNLNIDQVILSQNSLFIITITGKQVPKSIMDAGLKLIFRDCFGENCFYDFNGKFLTVIEKILPVPEVIFVEGGNRKAKEERLIGTLDISTNRINVIHNRYSQLNGSSINASLKENKPDTTDIDIKGRYLTSPLASTTVTDHASVMATMIAGGGNTWHLGKGAAWSSKISSSDFINLLPDNPGYFQQYNISVQNHSYGVGIENFYGADAAAYDAAINSNASLLHVFSSGNSGAMGSTTGRYAGLTGWANLTGSFKMAKNIITVGATDSFGVVAPLSSKGPAHDGRIKPELVAYGEDGSSGAAALVSGTIALLQQQFKQASGNLPANALIKSILLNSADDAGTAAPDYSTGFGSLNSLSAVKTIEAGRYRNGNVSNGDIQNFVITIPQNIRKLKTTLVWNDPSAAPNTSKALINDLDLELVNTVSNEVWKPWVLNSFPHPDSLSKPAVRNRDSLNNVEQITIENPSAGSYEIRVKGYQVTTAAQQFYLAYQLDIADRFEWYYPTGSDFIFPSATNLIRWENSFSNGTGRLNYSIDNGISWQLINSSVDLSKKFYKWDGPQYSGKALLRMDIANQSFTSDTFTIASRTNLAVGFNCPDSFLLYWNKNNAASKYTIYTMGPQYLEQVSAVTDTFLLLNKLQNPGLYYAVAPVFLNKETVRSYTLNYSLQGVECYIRSFLASLANNVAILDLELGSLYNINKIVLEKLVGNNYVPIQQLLNNTNLNIQFLDSNLTKGLNTYRIKIELRSGAVVYSLAETVYYFENDEYIVYPNPSPRQHSVNVAVKEINDDLMQLYNSTGAKVFEKILDDKVNQIPANFLGSGVYFIRILQNNKPMFIGKFIVL